MKYVKMNLERRFAKRTEILEILNESNSGNVCTRLLGNHLTRRKKGKSKKGGNIVVSVVVKAEYCECCVG